MRVAMLITSYHPIVGGAERQLGAIAPLLQKRGVEVHVLTRHHPGLEYEEIIDGVPVHRIPAKGPKVISALLYLIGVVRYLLRLKPDVIHAHSLFSPLLSGLMAKPFLRVPVITKSMRGGDEGDIDTIQKKLFGSLRLKFYRAYVDGFVVISQEIRNEILALAIPPDKIHFIPNGVDTDHFKKSTPADKKQIRQQLGLADVPTAIFTGRLAKEKRVQHIITIWDDVRKSVPNAQLLIAGANRSPLGESEIPQDLLDIAGEGIEFLGYISDVAPYLRAADIFVLPSVTEGLSNALLEAMASGCAVVITKVGGADDVIQHKSSGWLITPDNVEELRTGIITLFQDDDLRMQFSTKAYQRILEDYQLKVTIDRLQLLYQNLNTSSVSTTFKKKSTE